MKEITSGSPFNSGGSGPGAVVLDAQRIKDPMDAFKETFSISQQLQKDKAAEEERKRANIAKMLADLDFKTDGIRSKDTKYFLEGKNNMSGVIAKMLENGSDPTNPSFLKEHNMANTMKKAYEVSVSGSQQLNNDTNNAVKQLYAKPNDYDIPASLAKINTINNADLPTALQLSEKGFLVPKGWDFTKWATGVFNDKKSPFAPGTDVQTDKSGRVLEVQDWGKWDPEMKNVPKVQEVASWALRNEPDFRDYAVDQWGKLSQGQRDTFKTLAAKAPTGKFQAEDLFAYQLMEPFASRNETYKGYTPYAHESAKISVGNSQIKKQVENDVDRLLLFAGGDNSLYQEIDGKKHSRYVHQQPMGQYPDPVNGQPLPNFLEDVIHDGQTPEGRPIIKFKTTASAAEPDVYKADKDGYVTTSDPYELVKAMINSQYEKNAPLVIETFENRAKQLGAWKNGTFDPYAAKVKALSPGYELENLDEINKAREELNPDADNTDQSGGILGSGWFAGMFGGGKKKESSVTVKSPGKFSWQK